MRKQMWKILGLGLMMIWLAGCGNNQYEQLLVKKWKPKFNEQAEIKKRAKEHFKKMSKKHIAKLTEGINNIAAQSVYEFMPDGKYKILFKKDDEPETGTWKIIEGGKVLYIKSDRGKQQKITIVSLSSDKVVLRVDETKELVLLPG